MTLTQFVVNNLGKNVDFDGRYGAQCVDLVRQYFKDVLNIDQLLPVEGARDLFFNPGTQLKVTKESISADYTRGDVLVWDRSPSNKYGHVAILLDIWNTNKFLVLEQNGFKLDGCKIVIRSRDNLLGALWLPGRY